MALSNLSTRYPGRADPPSTEYPQGRARNATGPTEADGTRPEQAIFNDYQGFFSAALASAGISANGTIDTAVSSQLFDAVSAPIVAEVNSLGSVALFGRTIKTAPI